MMRTSSTELFAMNILQITTPVYFMCFWSSIFITSLWLPQQDWLTLCAIKEKNIQYFGDRDSPSFPKIHPTFRKRVLLFGHLVFPFEAYTVSVSVLPVIWTSDLLISWDIQSTYWVVFAAGMTFLWSGMYTTIPNAIEISNSALHSHIWYSLLEKNTQPSSVDVTLHFPVLNISFYWVERSVYCYLHDA